MHAFVLHGIVLLWVVVRGVRPHSFEHVNIALTLRMRRRTSVELVKLQFMLLFAAVTACKICV